MNKWLVIGAVALGAVVLLGNNKNTCEGRLFRLPNGKVVCEKHLSQMGYIYIQEKDKWYPSTSFQPSGQFAGINPNSQEWLNILIGLVQTGTNIWQQFGTDQGGLDAAGGDGGDLSTAGGAGGSL